MCKPELAAQAKVAPIRKSSSSLLSVDAFEKKPSLEAMGRYTASILVFLFAIEYALRYLFYAYKVSTTKVIVGHWVVVSNANAESFLLFFEACEPFVGG